ncbi:MAG: hypothetical protein JWQ44_1175 [Chthoniobacter sp.]|jgi:uncharacterized protein (DUF1501 family)|nr:hypothetical protein [Chthoniobacter sp.]
MRQAACAALGTIGLTSAIRDLRLIGSAAAQGPLDDYKALVCIFLSGGNDSNNLIVPRGADWVNYSAIRQNLAIPEAALHPIVPVSGDGRMFGLHPSCVELKTLFDEGKLATIFNVGVLSYPMTRAQYQSNSVPRPPQLFSHSDQVTHWQTSLPDQPPKSGWGGRIADLLQPRQIDLLNSNNSARIALCTSVNGANTFEVGNTYQQYHVSTNGAVLLSGVTGARLTAVKDLIGIPSVNLQQQAYSEVADHALDTGQLLNDAIQYTGTGWTWEAAFPTSSLGNQLKMVARLIAARGQLKMKRQIFFVSVGGYDTHTNQTAVTDPTTGSHANLLNELSEAIYAFQRGMEQLGRLTTNPNFSNDPQIANRVTAFTASDFGRTFPTNGEGSDHGWGSHHLVVGGAVKGKRTYGTFPVQQVNGPDDTSTGRWIPRLSVDEYSATLARWFGVEPGLLSTVFPNLGRFATPDLGFMS